MTEPGSYTVTGHTGVGDEAVEVGAPVCGVDEVGYPDLAVEPVQAVSKYSGDERQQSVIVVVVTTTVVKNVNEKGKGLNAKNSATLGQVWRALPAKVRRSLSTLKADVSER